MFLADMSVVGSKVSTLSTPAVTSHLLVLITLTHVSTLEHFFFSYFLIILITFKALMCMLI